MYASFPKIFRTIDPTCSGVYGCMPTTTTKREERTADRKDIIDVGINTLSLQNLAPSASRQTLWRELCGHIAPQCGHIGAAEVRRHIKPSSEVRGHNREVRTYSKVKTVSLKQIVSKQGLYHPTMPLKARPSPVSTFCPHRFKPVQTRSNIVKAGHYEKYDGIARKCLSCTIR